MTQERSGPLCAVAHGWLEELGEGEDSEPDCLQPTAPSWTERVRQVLDDEGQAGWCPYGLLLVAWMARARHWMEPMDPEAERQFTALVDRLRAHARAMPVASGNVDEVLRGGVRLAALLLLQEAGIDGVAVEAQVFASRARWFSDCRRLLGEETGSGRKTITEVLPRVQLGVGTQADSLFVVFLDALVQIEREGGLPACPEALIARVYGDAVLAAP